MAITSAADCAYAGTAVDKRLVYAIENPTDDTECFVTHSNPDFSKWAPASSPTQENGPAICYAGLLTRDYYSLVRFRSAADVLYLVYPTHTDVTCETGIRALVATNICCLQSCGKCGDSGCGDRPGGDEGCCVKSIDNSKRSCAEYPPPCIVPVISTTTTPTTTTSATTITPTVTGMFKHLYCQILGVRKLIHYCHHPQP